MRKALAITIGLIGFSVASSPAFAVPVTLGALFKFNGTGASAGISGHIYDGAIHSGVFRSANGTNSDSYVLQGGDPFGGDTGDAFEVTQATGHVTIGSFDIYTFYNFGNPSCAQQVGTCITANPDTGYLEFLNSSGVEFTGILSLTGQAFGGIYGPAQFFANSGAVDLLPGQFMDIVLNNESSNYGGYNHPDALIPEPSTLALFGAGLAGLAGLRRRRKAKA